MFDNSNGLDLTSHPRLGVLLFVVVMLAAGKHMEVLTLLRRSLRLTRAVRGAVTIKQSHSGIICPTCSGENHKSGMLPEGSPVPGQALKP